MKLTYPVRFMVEEFQTTMISMMIADFLYRTSPNTEEAKLLINNTILGWKSDLINAFQENLKLDNIQKQLKEFKISTEEFKNDFDQSLTEAESTVRKRMESIIDMVIKMHGSIWQDKAGKTNE